MAIQQIKKKDRLLAIIISNNHECDGVDFITPGEFSQQVAYMHHPTGKIIEAHVHKIVHRNVMLTQEVLLIKKGKLRVDFYDDYKDYLRSVVLNSGDAILFVSGGHGFKVLEEVEMIEVKQGPYCGDNDKERFSGCEEENIKIDNINGDQL